MKRKRFLKLWSLVVLVTFFILCTKVSTQAQTLKEKALTGYKAALETNYFLGPYGYGEKYKADSFYLMDLNNDSIPELFVKAYFQGAIKGYTVYTYKNGSVQLMGAVCGGESVTEVFYYKKAKLLREDWTRWNRTVRAFWKMKDSKISIAFGYLKMENEKDKYYTERKGITKQAYTSLVKRETGSEKAVNIEKLLIKNTSANRKKYLSVKENTPSIKLNKSSVTLALDGTASVQLKAVLSGLKGKVTWSSSNKKVAVVSKLGKVTGKKAGYAVITVKVGKYITQCKVHVKRNKSEIENEQAMVQYRKLLETGKFLSPEDNGAAHGFYLLDLDGNGVKEIIISRGKTGYLYTYYQNKTAKLLSCGGWGGNIWKYYKKNHVLLFEQSGSGIHEKTYYTIRNGRLVEEAHNSFDANRNLHFYKRNGKNTTKKNVEAYERQLNKEKPVELETVMGGAGKGFKKNTASNRNSYLK